MHAETSIPRLIQNVPRIPSAYYLGILVVLASVTGSWAHWRSRRRLSVESMLNSSGVNSFSDIPATPGVELGPRGEGEPKGDWSCRQSDMTADHDAARHLERGACCDAPFSQPRRQALESSSEDHGKPPQDKGYGIDYCKGFGIVFDSL